MAKTFLALDFSLDVVPFQSKEVGRFSFSAYGRQYRRMGLVYFVTSSQCLISARLRENMSDSCFVFCFGCNNESDPENGIALHRISFFNDPRLGCVRRRKRMDRSILSSNFLTSRAKIFFTVAIRLVAKV